MLFLIHDLIGHTTGRKKAERYLRQSQEQLRQRNEDLALINTLNNAANRGKSLQAVIRLLVQEIRKIFSAEGVTAYLLDENNEHLVMQNLDLPPAKRKQTEKLIGRKIPEVQIPLKPEGIFTGVLQAGKPKLVNEPAFLKRLIGEFAETTAIAGKHHYKILYRLLPAIQKILKLKSVMLFPLTSSEKTIGLLSISSKRAFNESELCRLENISMQIAAIIKRKQDDETVKGRLLLEETVAKASSRFAAFSELDEAINTTLEDIGLLCKAGHAYLFQFSDGGKTMSNTHEWCAEGVNPQIDNLQDLHVELFHWSIKKLRGGEPIHITDVANLPPEAATEKANLEAQGIKSLLILPLLKKGGDLTGFIGFDNVKDIGRWRDYDLSILHIISGIMLNAFQRKNFERTILEQKEFLQNAIESLPHPFYVIDANNYEIKMANSATYSADLPPGITCHTLSHKMDSPCTGPEHSCTLEEVKKTRAPVILEHIHHNKDGEPRNVEVHAYPVFDKEGNIAQIIEYTLDITAKKKLQKRLESEKQRAESADKLKSIFLANMSHDIRTPLNSIIGFIDLALSGDDISKENREYLQHSKDSGRLLLSLINDILDLSKIESGQLEIEQIPFSLKDTLRSIGARARVLLADKRKNVSLRHYCPDNFNTSVSGDPLRLEQILNNLISNAVKFTEKGFIEYGVLLKNEKTLEFYVRDTGIGMSLEEQKQIFEPFRQAKTGTTRKYGGTGLGLTISKKLVELKGGRMGVQSEREKGSTFYFSIPYKPVEVSKSIEKAQDKAINKTKRSHTILVAEDDLFSRKLIQSILHKQGYTVLRAKDGRDAVSIYKTDPSICLVLMDVQMPHLDGLEATRVIRSIEDRDKIDRMPIIALTADAMPGDDKKCFEAGCDDYLTKPVDVSLLLAAIARYI